MPGELVAYATEVIAVSAFGLLRSGRSFAAAAREPLSLRLGMTGRCPTARWAFSGTLPWAFSSASVAVKRAVINRPPHRFSLRAGKSFPSLCRSMRRSGSARKASSASLVCKSHRTTSPSANKCLTCAASASLIRTTPLIVKLGLYRQPMEPHGGAERKDSTGCGGHGRPRVGDGAKGPVTDGVGREFGR